MMILKDYTDYVSIKLATVRNLIMQSFTIKINFCEEFLIKKISTESFNKVS